MNNSIVYQIRTLKNEELERAIEFYHKLGFEDTNSEQTVDGIRFTPMKLKIREMC